MAAKEGAASAARRRAGTKDFTRVAPGEDWARISLDRLFTRFGRESCISQEVWDSAIMNIMNIMIRGSHNVHNVYNG
jgi:hypothetical protein